MNPNQESHTPKGPNPKEAMKNRLPVSEMKESIETFLLSQKQLYIATNNNSPFPDLEVSDYRYISGKFILILTPASLFLEKMEDGCQFTGFIFEKEARGLKMAKRVYGQFTGKLLSNDADILKPLAETDPMMKKMLSHGAKFFQLTPEALTVFFNPSEVFTMDENMNPSFAEFMPNGKKRYENSHHVLMCYEDREVIFNSIIEDGIYYTLTKADSNKVNYIKNGGECQFFDGRDNHFTSKITILPEEKVAEIYQKLKDTNNSFFKSPEGLLALSYGKDKTT